MPLANAPLEAVNLFPLNVFSDKFTNYCFNSLCSTCTANHLIAQFFDMAEAILSPFWRIVKTDYSNPSAADKESLAHYMIEMIINYIGQKVDIRA